jgi:DNA-binding PadR family transcriptional regulator
MRHVVYDHDGSENKALSEPVFLILASLADQPRHGYALMLDIQRLSNGRVMLSTGTLYGALRRLLEDGLIERFQQEDTSRDKQAYKLTIEGRRQLQAEVARKKQLTRIATGRMKESEA